MTGERDESAKAQPRASHAQYLRLAVHAGASARAVVRAARRLLAHDVRRDRARRRARHAWLHAMLDAHDEAGALHANITSGRTAPH